METESARVESYEPELFVDDLKPLPDPLDSNIASVSVWTDANDPTDGYDVLLNASVGTDIIQLVSNGAPIDVQVEIWQAQIDLKFAHCSYGYGRDHDAFFGQGDRFVDEQTTRTSEAERSVNVDIGTKNGFSASLAQKATVQSQRNSRSLDIRFEHHAATGLRFGDWQKKETLSGQYVPPYRGWRAKHNPNHDVSGVLAALRVKENWLNFKNVSTGGPSRIAQLYNTIVGSTDSSDKIKQRLFPDLLKQLVLLGLQSEDDTGMATLAVSGFIVHGGDNSQQMLQSAHGRSKIEVPESLLLGFLKAPKGKEQVAFESAMRAARTAKTEVGRDFTPQSGYLDAQRAYFEMAIRYRDTGDAFAVDDLNERYGDQVLTDLRKLGAITSDRKNTAFLTTRFPQADPVYAFRALVRSQPTIAMTEELLLANPDASGLEIGRVLKKLLGRSWTESSQKRYGNQLKNWALHQQNEGRGRPFIISNVKAEIVDDLHSQGRPSNEIAELIDVATETVRRYLRQKEGLSVDRPSSKTSKAKAIAPGQFRLPFEGD